MIVVVIGGVGSGKSLSIVKEIAEKSKEGNFAFTNFRLKNIKYHRLKMTDLVKEKDNKLNVNWDFWEKARKKNKSYSIYLDEAQNIAGSRSSMSRLNKLMSRWLSQIRKILSDSSENHLYIITQKPRRIDVNFRELAQVVIECSKLKDSRGNVYIVQKFYDGFENYEIGRCTFKSFFCGNKYFKHYNTNEMVTFKDGEEYI